MKNLLGRRSLLLFAAAVSAGLLPAARVGATLREEACWTEERPARVWPEVVFRQAADLADYRRTMAQSRDEVRLMLTGELLAVLREVGSKGGNPKELVESVLGAVLAFDDVHDRHKERAVKGVPPYLEGALRSAMDELYRANRIPMDQRRLRFVSGGLVNRLKAVRREMSTAAPGQKKPSLDRREIETLRDVVEGVDLVAYATFSSDGSRQAVTLTLENVRTRAVCGFEAAGDVSRVPSLLAQEVFRNFQAVEYAGARNPNPHLTWIRPSLGEPVTTAAKARHYCRSQGENVRLPYALELTTAAGVGADGASYVEGGIPRLTPGPWIVADRLREDEQYYYFQPQPNAPDNHPAGPIRTDAGLEQVSGRYWCVIGSPDPHAVRVEKLYELYRAAKAANPSSPALAAVEYLLNREGALSARESFAQAFPDEGAAWAVIEAAGCRVARSGKHLAQDRARATVCAVRPNRPA